MKTIKNILCLLFAVITTFAYSQTVQLDGTNDPNFVNVNGNVGIGTTNPLSSLQVGGDEKIKLGTTIGANKESGLYWFHNTNYSIRRGAGTWTAPDYQQLLIDWPTGIVLDPGLGNNAGYGRSFVEIKGGKGLRVTEGDVGIGTESPRIFVGC